MNFLRYKRYSWQFPKMIFLRYKRYSWQLTVFEKQYEILNTLGKRYYCCRFFVEIKKKSKIIPLYPFKWLLLHTGNLICKSWPKNFVGKKYAFAIISRLAKSLGNSIWNKKHENNMWQVARIVASEVQNKRCSRYRRGAFLCTSGAPFRGRPVLNAIRGITSFLCPIAFCGLIVGCNKQLSKYGK